MNLNSLAPSSWFNAALAKQPMNWAVIWVFASLWLLLFHALVQGFLGMGGNRATFEAAPGQLAVSNAATGAFATPGAVDNINDLPLFQPGGATGASPWGDSVVARFAEDGWTAN